MTLEQQLREQLDRSTADVPTVPDLAATLGRGRARRRRRGLLTTAGGAAGAAVAAAVVVSVLAGGSVAPGERERVATDPAATTPSTTTPSTTAGSGDFVAGTDRDEILARVVARHLPSLGAPDDVYPSDWDHAGPMPDADHADATDWQATYPIDAHTRLLVFTGYGPPDEQQPQAGLTHSRYSNGETYVFSTSYAVAGSSFTAVALENVTADSWRQAASRRTLDAGTVDRLVADGDLAFPLPASRR
jgi:hypothetical protein